MAKMSMNHSDCSNFHKIDSDSATHKRVNGRFINSRHCSLNECNCKFEVIIKSDNRVSG